MNQFAFVGRLTADPEVKYTSSDMAIANPTIAVDRPSRGEKGADFIRLTIFGKQAESLCKYKKKGEFIAVTGYVQTGSYEGKNGKVYTTDFVCNRVEFIGGQWTKKDETQETFDADDVPDAFASTDEEIPF